MSYKFYLGSFFLYNLQFVSGDTGIMIFGKRNGKAGKKCSRLGSNEYECNVGWGHLPSEAKASKPDNSKFKN